MGDLSGILLIKMFYSLTQITLKFVPEGPLDKKSALVQFMAWHLIGDMSFPE